jgi:hypothetical protein
MPQFTNPMQSIRSALHELTIAAEAAGWDQDKENLPALNAARDALAIDMGDSLPAITLYALIKRSSKYSYQHDGKIPFPIEISDWDLGYPIRGNSNNYRFCDVNLYVRQRGQFTPVNGGRAIPAS